MTAGLMQLVAYGAQDVYLTGSPQITFFKVVYRRHTNFSVEVIEHAVIGEPDFDKRVTVVFTRNADLINKMYVKIKINSFDPKGNNFGWVRRLGHAIIHRVEFELGDSIMDRQYGTWLDIWYELARKVSHERGYNHMIGDIPTLTEYNADIKPEYTLFVPLQFWFNRYVGLSIPLIALQYHDARIHIHFTKKEKLIVKDCNLDDTEISINNVALLTNYIYLDSEERKRFAQVGHEYLIEQTQFNGLESNQYLIQRYQLDYNHPTKEIIWALKNSNYTTGKQFIYYTHRDKWDEPVDESDPNSLTELELGSSKIIRESISISINPNNGGNWTSVQGLTTNVIGSINITNNSTTVIFVNPTSLSVGDYGITDKIQADILIDINSNIIINNIVTTLTVRDFSIPHEDMTDTRNNPCDPLVNQFSNYGILIDGTGNPIQTAKLQMNGHDRFDDREGDYFNYVQPYQHHSNTPKDGINVYSFSLFPEEHQPSGTANLSRIDSTVLTLRFFDSTITNSQPPINIISKENELWIFCTNYNILRIMSGLAGIAYEG